MSFIVDEIRSIRLLEHSNQAKVITPFAGAQVDICEAFKFDICYFQGLHTNVCIAQKAYTEAEPSTEESGRTRFIVENDEKLTNAWLSVKII